MAYRSERTLAQAIRPWQVSVRIPGLSRLYIHNINLHVGVVDQGIEEVCSLCQESVRLVWNGRHLGGTQ